MEFPHSLFESATPISESFSTGTFTDGKIVSHSNSKKPAFSLFDSSEYVSDAFGRRWPVSSTERKSLVTNKSPYTVVVLSTTADFDRHASVHHAHGAARNLYPHVFDSDLQSGQAIKHIENALSDARNALESYSEPNLQAVATSLGNIATSLAAAEKLIENNSSLASIVGFIRRAALVTSSDDFKLAAFNELVNALNHVIAHPLLSLAEAADIAESLAEQGWQGDHTETEKLIALLLFASEEVEAITSDSSFATGGAK